MFDLLRTRSAAALFTAFAAFFVNPSTAIAAQAMPIAPAVPAVSTSFQAVMPAPEPRSLDDMVRVFVDRGDQDAQELCLAKAIYFEARGESLEGQLAVARVIMNRAASGRYPSTWCGVVKQPWQFSFVNPRTGAFPSVDRTSHAWHKALGITRLAISGAVPSLSNDVLWYHANYVSPSWGSRLDRVTQIGAHIFYRS